MGRSLVAMVWVMVGLGPGCMRTDLWMKDATDACRDSEDCAAGFVCWEHECAAESWEGVGGSAFAPWGERVGGSNWGGGVSASPGGSDYPSIDVDRNGYPWVAWEERVSGAPFREIYVRRFDGVAWVEVGAGSATGAGISLTGGGRPSLALDGMDRPVVAWEGSGGGWAEVYVKRFDGTSWVEVGSGSATGGGISDTVDSSLTPSLALGADNNPVVVWMESSSTAGAAVIYGKRFDGAAWVEVGAGSASGGGISGGAPPGIEPGVAVDASNRPMVAWSALVTTGHWPVYVKRFDGAAWVEVGAGSASGAGVSQGAGGSGGPSLAIDYGGHPVIAWQAGDSGAEEIYVRRFDGLAWVEAGSGSASGGGISGDLAASTAPALALDPAGAPVVAWRSGTWPSNIFLRRFDGTSWAEVGAGSASGGGISRSWVAALNPDLAVDASGRVVVAWSDRGAATHAGASGSGEIYVARYDASTGWGGLGEGNAAGGGVSNDATASINPSVAMDAEGGVVVAWENLVAMATDEQIYLRRLVDGQWREQGGSASGGGVSNTPGWSRFPQVVLTAAGLPIVAWQDYTAGQQIYVAAFDGVRWGELGVGSASGGGVSNTGNWSNAPSMALDSAGRPVVAWYEHVDDPADQYEIYARRFDGTSWVELGAGSASGGGITNNPGRSILPSVAVDAAGEIFVAWTDDSSGAGEIYVRGFDGVSWRDVGVSSATGGGVSGTGAAGSPRLVAESPGRLLLAWVDANTGHAEVYVRRFDGVGWVEQSPGSASGGGVSLNHGAGCPALALAAGGQPVLAWGHVAENGAANNEIYVKRFDGVAWREVGVGSASGGGISNSTAWKSCPSLAVGGGRACIAWDESGPISRDVVVRCAPVP